MTMLTRIGATLVVAAAIAGATATSSLAECKAIGSVGTGINESTAKFMAEAGLKNIREDKGMKPNGPVTFKCETGMLTECHARQNACK
jgi:hypothetical protein